MKNMTEIWDHQWERAMGKYSLRFDNDVYRMATESLNVRSCNHLLDDAMVLCGCPYTKRSRIPWGYAPMEFLKLFIDQYQRIARGLCYAGWYLNCDIKRELLELSQYTLGQSGQHKRQRGIVLCTNERKGQHVNHYHEQSQTANHLWMGIDREGKAGIRLDRLLRYSVMGRC